MFLTQCVMPFFQFWSLPKTWCGRLQKRKCVTKSLREKFYDEVKRFEVFDDVSFHIKQLIWRGKRLLEQVKQGATTAINIEAQLVLITLSTAGFFDKFSIEETKNFKVDIVKSLRNNPNLVNIDVHKNLKVFEWSEKLLKAFSKLS